MLVLKIKEVFIPSAISKAGISDDIMNPSYIGFRTEVLQEIAPDGNVVANSRFIGLEYMIIEKSCADACRFLRGDIVSAPKRRLSQGLCSLEWEDWIKTSKILINNADTPIIRSY